MYVISATADWSKTLFRLIFWNFTPLVTILTQAWNAHSARCHSRPETRKRRRKFKFIVAQSDFTLTSMFTSKQMSSECFPFFFHSARLTRVVLFIFM